MYGVLRTADAITPSLSGIAVAISLATYVAVYTLIFSAGTLYIYRLLRAGLREADADEIGRMPGVTPSRPLAAAGEG